MKAAILVSGLVAWLSEEASLMPKPMSVGGRHFILWHIMKISFCYGIKEFVMFCGYKGHVIKEYTKSYLLNLVDVTFDFKNNSYVIGEHNA